MKEIKFISKNMIHHGTIHGESINKIELTPWDLNLIIAGPIQKGLLFSKPTNLQINKLFKNNIIDHLKNAFEHALGFFYPLSGRLVVAVNEDDTCSFYIDCSNKGAYFAHTVVDSVTIKDILDPLYTPRIVQYFFPLNGKINIRGDSNPLLAVQVNELVDGFFIGCTMNHSVGDGFSFWHFLNSLSEISHGGINAISTLPVFKRWFPNRIESPIRIPSSLCSEQARKITILPLLEERVFHFSKARIATLKARANQEMNTTNISSLQALSALLWQSVIRCQKINFDLEVKYILIVDARARLQPSISEYYFGNAIFDVSLTMKAGEVLNQSLREVASLMNEAISLQTSGEIVKRYEKWAKNPKLTTMSVVVNNNLVNFSAPRFDVYGNDFGWGKPVGVRSGLGNKCDGRITLFSGIEKGSIDIEICSSPEKLNALDNDVEFMEGVTM